MGAMAPLELIYVTSDELLRDSSKLQLLLLGHLLFYDSIDCAVVALATLLIKFGRQYFSSDVHGYPAS